MAMVLELELLSPASSCVTPHAMSYVLRVLCAACVVCCVSYVLHVLCVLPHVMTWWSVSMGVCLDVCLAVCVCARVRVCGCVCE